MRFSWLAAAVLGVTLWTNGAAAQAPKLTSYEAESVRIALDSVGGGEVEPQPEGKLIEEVLVVPLDVLEPRDPAPMFLNWFHVTSQKSIIRAEVLLHPGQAYDQALVDESARNLRSLQQLSVVLIVPLKAKEPGKVKVLVVTKDVWSLRMAYQPVVEDGRLTYLSVQPSETNILGTHQTLAANIVLTPTNYSLGGSYAYPRIGGSRINSYVSASAILNCHTNQLDGASGYFQYGQPLYSTLTEWSWQVAGTWSSQIYTGPGIDQNQKRHAICGDGRVHRSFVGVPNTASELEPVEDEESLFRVSRREVSVPIESRSENIAGQFVITRSFFRTNKLNLSTGAEVAQFRNSPLDVDLSQLQRRRATYVVDNTGAVVGRESTVPLDPDVRDSLAVRPSPNGRRRISPYAQLHAYANRWQPLVNYNSLGFQEDWPMGHDVYLRVYPSFSPLSSHDGFGTFASASYAWPLGTGFLKVLLASRIELGRRREGVARSSRGALTVDTLHQAGLHWASSSFGVGRVVADFSASFRPSTTFQGLGYTGGTGRLRGYNASEFGGPGVIDSNVEFRSTPLHLFSVNAGGVLFFDAGGAFEAEKDSTEDRGWLKRRFDWLNGGHTAGVGLRFLAPQLDRDVFRVDVGFPLRADRLGEVRLIGTFYHAFSAPFAPPPVLLPQ